MHRRRAVVLNADIASYSRLMADDQAATVAAVREYQLSAKDAVGAAYGTMVNVVGDSFTAVFDDARAAMRAAIAVCRAVKRYNRPRPRTRHMYFRMGLDAGDVVVADDGRYFGEPLNVAVRVQAIAEVGGINVTEAVYQELDEPALRLISIGRRRLKNIPEMVRVYRLAGVVDHDDHDRDWPARPTPASIAVLPTIAADDTATRGVAVALRMGLLSTLARNPGLRVINVQAGGAGVDERPGTGVGAAYILTVGVVRSGAELSHMIVAALQLHVGGDLEAALAEARQALQRRPTCDVTFVVEAGVQRYLGAWEAAVQACRRALDLVSTPQPWHFTVPATAYYIGQRHYDAAETAERLVQSEPNNVETLLVSAAAQQALGLRRRARATVASIVDRFPDARCQNLASRYPYRDPNILQRWTTHLVAACLP